MRASAGHQRELKAVAPFTTAAGLAVRQTCANQRCQRRPPWAHGTSLKHAEQARQDSDRKWSGGVPHTPTECVSVCPPCRTLSSFICSNETSHIFPCRLHIFFRNGLLSPVATQIEHGRQARSVKPATGILLKKPCLQTALLGHCNFSAEAHGKSMTGY